MVRPLARSLLVALVLNRLDDPGVRAAAQGWRGLRRLPDRAQRSEKRLRLACAIEVQVDHDVVRIVDRAKNPVTTHAAPLPASGIALEGRLPGVVVVDGMFNVQRGHLGSFMLRDSGSRT